MAAEAPARPRLFREPGQYLRQKATEIRARSRNEKLRSEIRKNSGIFDTTSIKDRTLEGRPISEELERNRVSFEDLAFANRASNLLSSPELRDFFDRIGQLDTIENSTTPSKPENDPVLGLFKQIFSDKELLNEWLESVDAHVSRSSEQNLAELAEAYKYEEGRYGAIKKNIVIVGGGPHTAIVAGILSPFFKVTVVTEQERIGMPWRFRPLFANSSIDTIDSDGPRVPLLEGSTTPISTRGIGNLDTDIIPESELLTLQCDDGTTKKCPSGRAIGDVTATNLVFNSVDYIVSCKARPIINYPSQERALGIYNSEDRQIGQINADAVIFLTGPEKEDPVFKFDNYSAARSKFGSIERDFEFYESLLKTASVLGDEERIKSLFESGLQAPQLLTLPIIERLYSLWFRYGNKPELFPFTKLMQPGVSVADIGAGDNGRIFKELIDGNAPDYAYPPGLKAKLQAGQRPQTTLFGVAQTTPDEYRRANRRRYGRVFTEDTSVVPGKALGFDQFSGSKIDVDITDPQSPQYAVSGGKFDYAFVGIGSRETPNTNPGGVYQAKKFRDSQGNVVGLVDANNNYVAGPATRFRKTDFPQDIQNIITALNIPENTIALWVHAILTERLAWTLAEQYVPDSERIKRLARVARGLVA